MTTRELAIYFAGGAHKAQMYGESPYLLHLSTVDGVLAAAGFKETDPVRIAAWLHDVVEDTDTTLESVAKTFGPTVADLVWRVTNEPGENRKVRARKTYPKINGDEHSLALKLADRIANLEHSAMTFSRFGLMYVKEDQEFQFALTLEWSDNRVGYLWNRYLIAIAAVKSSFGVI